MKPDLIRRQKALQKITTRYRKRAFHWGKHDCLTMLRSHLVAMGHRGLPKLPRYKNALGAARALNATSHNDLTALLDSILPRIAPAEMLPGDVALMQGDAGLDAVTICVGRKTFGYFEGLETPVMIVPLELKGAWRA